MIVQSLLRGALFPALVSAVVLAVAWWRPGVAGRRGWPAVAIALGYVVGHTAIIGRPPFPAIESTQWPFWLALAAALVATPLAWVEAGAWTAWIRRVVFAVGVPLLLLSALFRHRFGKLEGVLWLAGLALAFIVLAWAVESLADRLPGPAIPGGLVVAASAASAVILLSGSALVSQLGGVLAATLGAVTVATLLRPGRSLESSGAFGFVVVYWAMLLSGRFYVEVAAPSAILLALAPLSGLVLRSRRLSGSGRFRGLLVVVALTGAIGGAALAVAWLLAPDYGAPY